MVVDSREASIGISDGQRIDVLWTNTSFIMGKHRQGGQSAQRFERGRDEAVKQWLRKVVGVVKDVYDGRELIVGGPGMTKDKFVKELPSYIIVKDIRSCGYTDENGLYELMGVSRYR